VSKDSRIEALDQPIRQAVVLAGGLGTRLGSLTRTTPKPLLDVAGRPFLEYVVWNLRRQGVRRLLLSIGYLYQAIRDHFGDGSDFGVEVDYAIEHEPAGTGGALRVAASKLEAAFFLLNGDTLFDVNLYDLAMGLGDSVCALALRRMEDGTRYGSISLDGEGHVVEFKEKLGGQGLINGGVYAVRREILDAVPSGSCSIEEDVFPALATQKRLAGRVYDAYFLDIGLPETLSQAQVDLPAWRRRPAVFFDRDGVINVDHGYVHDPEHFEWTPDAPEAVKWCNDNGYFAIMVTNQSGIGRGYYDEACFEAFTRWIQDQLMLRGAHFDAVYYCPHHPTAGVGAYKQQCGCRKPAPGMLLRALEEWPIDAAKSLVVGDKEKDMQAAREAGLRGVQYQTGSLLDFLVRAFLSKE
jgi:D-glycero-D-manno-heptose 1,7-bisphosphate phosphatase